MSFLFPSPTITLEAALRDLAKGSPKARAAAAHALGDVEDPTEKRRAVDALITALDDDRPDVRAEACASLGQLGDPSALPRLIRCLDEGEPVVRQNAAIALGTLGHPDGFAPLAEALHSGPPDLRFQAATSIAEIDPAHAFEPLLAALDDGDPQVVAAAALSLGAIGDKRAVSPLITRLDHREAATRFDVGYALADLGDPSGRDQLVAGLAEPDRAWDAVTALTKLATTDDTEAIDRALGSALLNKHTPPEATVLAAGAILRIDAGRSRSAYRDAARRVLIAGLAARKVHVRGLAVEQLGDVAGDWALAPLDKLAHSGKGADLGDAIDQARRAITARAAAPGDQGIDHAD